MEEVCDCPSPEQCRCPNSYWMPMFQQYQSPTPQFPPHHVGHPGYQGASPGPMPSGFFQFSAAPSGMASPMPVPRPHPSAYSFPGINTVPFPLSDRTNTPTQAQPRGTTKRSRTSALSGNSAPPKRVRMRDSTGSNAPVSVSAAATCGVGSSIPVPRTPGIREQPSPHTPVPPPIIPIPPPASSTSTQRPDADFTSRKRANNTNKASDVYFFVRPLTSAVPPDVLPSPCAGEEDLNSPDLLTEKPSAEKFSHLGCRLCP